MNKKATYKAAHAVAPKLETHFAMHLSEALERGETPSVVIPTAEVMEVMIDTAFWASLLKEEGRSPKISLAYLAPEHVDEPMLFAERLPLTSHTLLKLSPGFERPGIHLGVWQDDKGLHLWGATSKIPSYSFVLNVPEPGLLVIKHRRADDFGKFTNIAVLNGDEVKIVDDKSASLPNCPKLVTSLLGFHSASPNSESVNALVQPAVSMRAHGRGGLLLIVPNGTEKWRNSIRQPIHYALDPPFTGLAEHMRQRKYAVNLAVWQANLAKEVDEVAGLTAVDGATLMNDQYELLAFGAKIIREKGGSLVEEILETEPVIGHKGMLLQAGQNGGTRHISAAQFVHDQHDCIALVASQDGRFTVFSWSPIVKMVQAHRIEVLLL